MDGTALVWINGDFGVGKTTLAKRLRSQIAGSALYDPEYLGYLVRDLTEQQYPDFQDWPIWSELLVACAQRLVASDYPMVIMPMTILDPVRRARIAQSLGELDIDFVDVLLLADDDELRARITNDILFPEDPERDQSAQEWRLSRIGSARRLLEAGCPGTVPIDTTGRTVDQLSETMVSLLPNAAHR